jgi:uncharacterized membrane protein
MNTSIITSIPDQYTIMLANYASIVEKTNQQLSMWHNPYGLMVGILTLIVAVGAIIVSIILINNSSEQKKRQKDFFDEQERIIKEKQEKDEKLAKDSYENSKRELDNLIKEQQEKLKSANVESKKKIQEEIDSLKRQSATIGVYNEPSRVYIDNNSPYSSIFGINTNKSMVCSVCGKTFQYEDGTSNPLSVIYSSSVLGHNKRVNCRHCGAVNFPL